MAIKGQLDKTKRLILRQWKATLGTFKEKKEAEKLALEHFFDKENEGSVMPQRISFSTKKFQDIPVKKRAILVLVNSNAFSYKEIGTLLQMTDRTVQRIYSGL